MKKLLLTSALALLLAVSVFASGTAESGDDGTGIGKIKLSYAELNPEGHPMAEVGRYFAEKVSEYSGGAMTIEVFASGMLGSEKECMQFLQVGGGGVDIFRGNTNAVSDYNMKKLSLFSMPYTFRDREHLWNVLESEIGTDFLNEPQQSGSKMVGLFYTEEGARHFFTSEPVSGMADLSGKKFRVPKTQVMSETVKALGIEPTPIDWGELYTSLQTGVVDGAEQPFAGYYNNKFYEVSPYYVLDGHTYSPGIVLMSEAVWNKLSDAQRDVIVRASKAAQDFCKENAAKVDAATIEKIRSVATVIEIEDKASIQEATNAVVAKYIAGYEDEMAAIKNK